MTDNSEKDIEKELDNDIDFKKIGEKELKEEDAREEGEDENVGDADDYND